MEDALVKYRTTAARALGAGAMTAVLCAASGPAAAGMAASLRCPEAPPAYCSALAEALTERWPQVALVPEGGAVAIEMRLSARTATHVAGHLDWQGADGIRHRGPTVEVTLFDGAPEDSAARDLARGLAALADLPF